MSDLGILLLICAFFLGYFFHWYYLRYSQDGLAKVVRSMKKGQEWTKKQQKNDLKDTEERLKNIRDAL